MVKGFGKCFETVAGQTDDQIGIHGWNAGIPRQIVSAEEIRRRMASANAGKHFVAKRLRIDAGSCNAVFLCNGKFFGGNGVRSAGFQRKFFQTGNVGFLIDQKEQFAQLIGRKNGWRSAADVDGFQAQAKFADGLKVCAQVGFQFLQIFRDQSQQFFGSIGNKGAIGAPRGAKRNGNIHTAIARVRRSNQLLLGKRHVGCKRRFFGNDKIFIRQNALGARFADAAAQKIGCNFGGSNTGKHSPRRAITQQFPPGGNNRRTANHFCRFFLGIIRRKIQCAAANRLFAVAFDGGFGAVSVGAFCQFQAQFRRALLILRRNAEFFPGEKDHAQRLNIIYVDIPV